MTVGPDGSAVFVYLFFQTFVHSVHQLLIITAVDTCVVIPNVDVHAARAARHALLATRLTSRQARGRTHELAHTCSACK